MGVLFTYTGEAAETAKRIEEAQNIIINRLYKHSNGFYWKLNNKGYIHVIMPVKINLDGKFSHYEVEDRLLTKDNMLKYSSSYGNFQTIEDCIKDIETNMEE